MVNNDPRCILCEGTGFVYLARSWFPADGYTRSRCGICGGDGFSDYRPSADYVAQTKELRRRALDLEDRP